MAEVEEAVAAAGASASPGRTPRAPRRNLGHLPKELERIERLIEPQSTDCPCGCGRMTRIGEDRTERLDIVPDEASGHRHRAPEVRLPNLRARGHPGGGAGAPDRRRAADRGGAGPGADFQVPPITFRCTANRRSTPVRGWSWTVPRSPAGWARRRFT